MLSLSFTELRTVLCVGAHADDIEIGCGGTVLKLLKEQPGLKFVWVVFSAEGRRAREAKASARAFLKGAGKQKVVVKNFRDGFFPFEGREIRVGRHLIKIKPRLHNQDNSLLSPSVKGLEIC